MTSDSDFKPLVMRLLESGFTVYGFGERKTPQPFVDACSQFIYTENLETVEQPEDNAVTKTEAPHPTPKKHSRNELRMNAGLVKLLRTAVEHTSDEEGWAHLGAVGAYISNNSSFSPINYGYKKLSDLVKASELFEVQTHNKAVHIRDNRAK